MLVDHTRERLVKSAYDIICSGRLGDLSIDRITAGAGFSRRTFFLHFRSKDDLLHELLAFESRNAFYHLSALANTLDQDLSAESRIVSFFQNVVHHINSPKWSGCLFLRLAAEFADLRGHPLHDVVRRALRQTEDWFKEELSAAHCESPSLVAEQLMVLLYGLLMMQLVYRIPAYGDAVLDLLPGVLQSGLPMSRSRECAVQGSAALAP